MTDQNDNSTVTAAQHRRLLQALRDRPHNTIELRQIGIHHPAGRVLELKLRGYDIVMTRVHVEHDGYLHLRVGKYVLLREAKP